MSPAFDLAEVPFFRALTPEQLEELNELIELYVEKNPDETIVTHFRMDEFADQRLTTRVLLEERPSVLTLQRGQFLETGGGRVAYVIGDDDIATRRQITIGGRSLSAIEITGGLVEGDRVIISSIDQFRGAETVLITD